MKRISGRAIYGLTFAAIFAMIAGFAMSSISLTASTQNAQGNYISSSGAVTGLSYTSTVLGAVGATPPSTSGGTPGAPLVVTAGANTFCASVTCTAGNFAETVTYTFTTSMTGSVQIYIAVTAASGGGVATLYLKQAGTAVGGTYVMVWDLGLATSTITAVTLTAQQCSGATCP